MARVRRRGKARRRELKGAHWLELVTGADYFGDGFGDDDQWRAEAWAQCREEIMAAWSTWRPQGDLAADAPAWVCAARRYGRPGTRPWGWWQHEPPGGPFTVERYYPDEAGVVRLAGGAAEREDEFLARQGLLTPDERAALAAPADAVK